MARKSEQREIAVVSCRLHQVDAPAEVVLAHANFPGWHFRLAFDVFSEVRAFTVERDRAFADERTSLMERFAGRGEAGDSDRRADILTARLLRTVPIGRLERAALRAMRDAVAMDLAERFAGAEGPDAVRALARRTAVKFVRAPRPGRAGRSDLDYAAIASEYVRLTAQTATPVKALADSSHLSPSQVRNLLHEARRRGLLTTVAKGKAGGELTEKAIRLLHDREG